MKYKFLALVSITALFSSACGGGGGFVDSGGIGGSGLVHGTIDDTSTGLQVAGITFDTTNATITVNGDTSETGVLKRGMVVLVNGAIDSDSSTGVADTIEFNEDARGKVEAIDRNLGTLSVLGRTVTFDDSTVIENLKLADVGPGTTIRVSGFSDDDETILATRIDAPPGAADFRLRGVVNGLNLNTQHFDVGLLKVLFAGAEVIERGGPLSDGAAVIVSGTDAPSPRILRASLVRVLDAVAPVLQGRQIHTQAIITSPLIDDTFRLGRGRRVRLEANTRIIGGSRNDLVPRTLVRVFGLAATRNGSLIVATELRILRLRSNSRP